MSDTRALATVPKPAELYSTAEAAAYLGLTIDGVKYHVYQSRRLRPDKKVGHALIFTRETLDRFYDDWRARPRIARQ